MLRFSVQSSFCSRDQIKKTELGGACSTYVGEERCIQVSVGKSEGKREQLEDLGINGRIILR
jgi:hypothetical protein